MSPIVYCETNWIVALAFPHHQLHKAARRLREDATKGNCSLRIPLAALLEARGTLSDVATQFSTSFISVRNALVTAYENGQIELSTVEQSLQANIIDKYAQRNVLSILTELENDRAVTIISDASASLNVLREIRAQVDFRGKDAVDLQLLAAILHDRRQNKTGPAMLISHNKKEFDPRRGKVPGALYTDAKLLWRDDFDLATGIGQWKAMYETTPTPQRTD